MFQNRGTVYARSSQPELAIEDYKRALQLDPSLVAVHRSLANVYFRITQFEKAIPHFQEALANDAGNVIARMRLADSFARLSRRSEAIEQYSIILKAEPSNTNALRNRGIVLAQTDQLKAALDDFNRSIVLSLIHI